MSNWFSARILFASSMEGADEDAQLFEESIRVIAASSPEIAAQKAEALGRDSEHAYANEQGEMVRWLFVRVLEIQDLCEENISDGTEVYSRLFTGKAENE